MAGTLGTRTFVALSLAVLMISTAGTDQRALSTTALSDDPDDPAIWLHPTDPSRSLILGTNKAAAPNGALVVFGLDGRVRQTIGPLDRPNNVDVEYGFQSGATRVDIAVFTERLQHRLRMFAISADPLELKDLAVNGIPVLDGETGESAEPMGIALYRRPHDGHIFAIVSPKTGGSRDYLWQYSLTTGADGNVRATLARRFGHFSGRGSAPGEIGEIEAIVVDDELGYVYYADERFGIHKWHADPDHKDASREIAVFGTEGYQMDREGLAIYLGPNGTGYLVSTDQIPGGSILRIYRRQGEPGRPHEHLPIRELPISADDTDGIEVMSRALPGFARGLLVAMNSGARNFLIYRWEDLFPELP